MRTMATWRLALTLGVLAAWIPLDDHTASAADAPASEKAALKPLQAFVGEWKGVGQPTRGSTRGSWIEKADWAWKFEKEKAAFVFTAKDAKYFSAGRLEPGSKPGQFRFTATLPDRKTKIAYDGDFKDDRLILTAQEPPEGQPARVSIRTVAHGDRLLILYERRLGDSDRYLRLAEIGYTREGSDFGKAVVQRECVVTGGAGTIQVSFRGNTYWVCCTGCRDAFNDDPEGVLAEYRARKAEERK